MSVCLSTYATPSLLSPSGAGSPSRYNDTHQSHHYSDFPVNLNPIIQIDQKDKPCHDSNQPTARRRSHGDSCPCKPHVYVQYLTGTAAQSHPRRERTSNAACHDVRSRRGIHSSRHSTRAPLKIRKVRTRAKRTKKKKTENQVRRARRDRIQTSPGTGNKGVHADECDVTWLGRTGSKQ